MSWSMSFLTFNVRNVIKICHDQCEDVGNVIKICHDQCKHVGNVIKICHDQCKHVGNVIAGLLQRTQYIFVLNQQQ